MRGNLRVLVTGASSGVGAALARLLSSRLPCLGYGSRSPYPRVATALHLCGRKKEALAAIAKECTDLSEGACVVTTSVGDVGNEVDVNRIWDEYCSHHQGLDVFVGNAGVNRVGSVSEITTRDYDEVMNTNLRSNFLFIRHVFPLLTQQLSGQIVFTNSVRGLKGGKGAALYCASKFGLEGFTQALRDECVGSGVKVGAVYPAGIATPWWSEDSRGGARERKPDTSRFLEPEDVAEAIMTLIHQPDKMDNSAIIMPNATKSRMSQRKSKL